MENQHAGGSDIKTRPLCHRLRRFTPTASKGSEHFLPSGWKTSLHLTGASSTGIDLLSACIWDHMAHMPGRDTATRLSRLLFTTAWLRCKASLQWEHGPCNGIKKITKAKFAHIWTLNRVKGRHPIYRGHNLMCRNAGPQWASAHTTARFNFRQALSTPVCKNKWQEFLEIHSSQMWNYSSQAVMTTGLALAFPNAIGNQLIVHSSSFKHNRQECCAPPENDKQMYRNVVETPIWKKTKGKDDRGRREKDMLIIQKEFRPVGWGLLSPVFDVSNHGVWHSMTPCYL